LVKTTPNTLVLPGWLNSDEVHWQTIWEKKFGWRRVVQKDWNNPKKSEWAATIVKAVQSEKTPPVLICHSLGCIALAHAVEAQTDLKIRGAFIVAPPSFRGPNPIPEIQDFHPTPLKRFSFPTMLIASETDPYCDIEHSKTLAKHWGSTFHNAGDRHHIGSSANLGDWKEGQKLLESFLETIVLTT
jgi:uncharacterized protein